MKNSFYNILNFLFNLIFLNASPYLSLILINLSNFLRLKLVDLEFAHIRLSDIYEDNPDFEDYESLDEIPGEIGAKVRDLESDLQGVRDGTFKQ